MHTEIEYITYRNKIAAIANGEEVGEVTFPMTGENIYNINHTYVDNRKLSEEADRLRLHAAMPCFGWHGTVAAISATLLFHALSTKAKSTIRPTFQATTKY